MNEGKKTGMAVTLLVVGLIVGGLIAYPIGHSSGKNAKTDSSMMKDSSSNGDKMASATSDGVTVGGAKMVANKDIVDNAVNAKNVTTVVSLVKAAGLVDTLKSAGPFTVFAPNNDAFGKLPAETVKSLQDPANVDQLKTILTYHVVPGTYTSADLRVMAQKGEALTTVQGEKVMPVMQDNQLELKDAKGNLITIQSADIISSNGVTHVVNNVMMP